MNKDGRADYLWVSEDGRVTLYTNLRGKDAGHPTWWPQGEIASGVGASRENITFADINGDGRSDYLVIGGNGEVTEWQNGGNGGQSQIGPGVVFHDLNGEGVRGHGHLMSDEADQRIQRTVKMTIWPLTRTGRSLPT